MLGIAALDVSSLEDANAIALGGGGSAEGSTGSTHLVEENTRTRLELQPHDHLAELAPSWIF